jgi:Glycosyl hydrolases family 16
MRRRVFLVAAFAVLPPAALAFEAGGDVSYTAGGASRAGGVITRADNLRSDADAVRADLVSLEGAVDQLEQRVSTQEGQEPPPPSSVVYVAPRRGAKVSGVTPVRVRAPAGTEWVGVYSSCNPGNAVGEDLVQDGGGEWSVQWDTQVCSNGQQTLDTWAYRGGAALGNATITVQVSNSSPPPPDPGPTACQDTTIPGPIVGQGYTMRFSDCFDTLSRSVWCSHQWWEAPPPAGTQYVSDGALHVVSRRSDGYPNNTISSEPCGQSNPKSFKQGYFEARFRSTNGRGSMPAFWLFSTRHATNPAWPNPNPVCQQQGLPAAECLVSELDIHEGHEGVYPFPRGSQIFAGALHRNTGGNYGGGADQFRQVFVDTQPVNYGGNYHVYAAKWTMSEVCWYLDDVQQGCQPTYDSTNQPMHILFYQWPNSWNSLKPDSTTPDELHIEVDWVRVWQR